MLIIHADDLGMSNSENRASIEGLEMGPVNSASIMVPCPWFPEIASYAKTHQHVDFGLHLTLNSEWKNYKWGPVSAKDSVATLVNSQGYFFDNVPEVVQKGDPDHVEIELRNQVLKAKKEGIDITHLDAHMGAAMGSVDFLAAYIKVGREFNLPVLLDDAIPAMADTKIQEMLGPKDIVMDRTMSANPTNFANGMDVFYTSILNELEPGLNCLLIHLAYDDVEMRAITVDHPDWGAAWRQADFDFFNSKEAKKLVEDNNIVLVTWKMLRDKIVRAD
ncbi:polysaccharide deacetylase family protein [Flagellimonas flava]|nr:polysaccharide deacetylase family protein [Allomuricauda flava]